MTYYKLAEATADGTTTALTIDNIPSGYGNLILEVSVGAYTSYGYISFNGTDPTTNGNEGAFLDDGGTKSWSTGSDLQIWGINGATSLDADQQGYGRIWITNYEGGTTKSLMYVGTNMNDGTGTTYWVNGASRWNSSDAITSITWWGDNTNNMIANSRINLYAELGGSDGITTVS